jgi:hypothetical protein
MTPGIMEASDSVQRDVNFPNLEFRHQLSCDMLTQQEPVRDDACGVFAVMLVG